MARLIDTLTRSRAVPAATLSSIVTTSWSGSVPMNEKVDSAEYLSYIRAGYKANGVVFAVIGARMHLFAEAQPRIRNLENGRLIPVDSRLDTLYEPWDNGGPGELLARMEQDVSLAGNFYGVLLPGGGMARLQPDHVEVVVTPDQGDGIRSVEAYLYNPYGITGEDSVLYMPEQIVHYSPVPDPEKWFRGMSWLTPVVREVNADIGMTAHRKAFFENAATPNLLIKYQQKLSPETLTKLKARFDAKYAGVDNAFKTAVLDEGADLTVVGNTFEQMTFTAVQAAGAVTIAAAAGVPPLIAGIVETGDYDKAMKKFADTTLRPLWHAAAAALTKCVDIKDGEALVLDASDVEALQDGEQERAETFRVQAVTAGELIRSGYDPETVARAIQLYDLSVLKHTGGVPTALYPEGQVPEAGAAPTNGKKPSKDSPLVQGYKGDGKSG